MIGDHFRALLGTHGVSRALVSHRTSKFPGMAPEPHPLRPDPSLPLQPDPGVVGSQGPHADLILLPRGRTKEVAKGPPNSSPSPPAPRHR